MNKKDLFNAIDNIDEKFITDAGKYLKNVSPFQDEEPEELEPQKGTFSPIRLIVPIAASLTVIAGIAICLKTINFGINQFPETNTENAVTDSYSQDETDDTALGSAAAPSINDPPTDANENSDGIPETTIDQVTQTGELPFNLYGPDMVPITYDDISTIERFVTDDETGAKELDIDNWQTISCNGFAYIAEPLGNNYNNYANPYNFSTNDFGTNGTFDSGSSSRRIYDGEMFGDLVVNSASCDFKNIRKSSTEEGAEADYEELAAPQMFNSSYVCFDGELETNGYIVKIDGEIPVYWFFFGYGETELPLMNYVVSQSGSFSRSPIKKSFDGSYDYFSYIGELPAVRISSEYEAKLGAYFVDTNVRAASVLLSNIAMLYSADSDDEGYLIWADTNVTGIDGVPYGGITYDSTVQAVIDSARTTDELNYILSDKMDVMMINDDLSSFTIFRDIQSSGGRHALERVIDDTPLGPGIFVYFYDKDGNVLSHYEYAGTAVQDNPDRPVE